MCIDWQRREKLPEPDEKEQTLLPPRPKFDCSAIDYDDVDGDDLWRGYTDCCSPWFGSCWRVDLARWIGIETVDVRYETNAVK